MKVIHIYMFKRVYTLNIITIIVVCNYTNCSEYFVQKHVFFEECSRLFLLSEFYFSVKIPLSLPRSLLAQI